MDTSWSLLVILQSLWALSSSQTNPCFYNEPYIKWENPDYPDYSGFYVQNSSIFYDNSPPYDESAPLYLSTCGVPESIEDEGKFYGTYMYILEGSESSPIYLFQRSSANRNRLIISSTICAQSDPGFQSDLTATEAILNGTNCDWTAIDTANNVAWTNSGGQPITGDVTICDGNSGCITSAPTQSPTMAPHPTTAFPTSVPTTASPSRSPTQSTSIPTGAPSRMPTIKPTKLPTVASEDYLEPPCPAMLVHNLDEAFSANDGAFLRVFVYFV